MVPRLFLSLLVAACGTGSPSADPAASATRGFEPPVATNAESPVRYPPALYERGLEGTVVLRLFITDNGSVVADSTRVAESSGQAAFDSAAVHGVERMVFAP
ncbi:MAG: TonB family protein, partial [Gemmatimonadales bacterium]